ncbi:DEAD/DEAH box helicase [bacterium]|nr:DEAD/DEAH box helicase [bacterium]
MTFESLGLSPAMLETLAKKGFEEPTPIQALAIPRLLTPGPAVAARARTGTGKTAAFGIPLVEAIGPDKPMGRAPISALVLVPTRELAIQVTEEISSLKCGPAPRIACVYGGASMGEQCRRLAQGADIVVGTPGRVLDHIGRGNIDLGQLKFFILDEADEMLDMGFIDDIRTVMEPMGADVRMLLFSATLAPAVLDVVRERAGEIEIIEASTDTLPTELAEQLWIEVHSRDKLEALCRIVDSEEDFFGIVFVSTKVEADRLAGQLAERGYDAEGLHGDLGQDARERVLGKFRDKRLSILVATDVAARGLDIEKLTHVINWSLPHDPESYLHRVGRTGRAGNSGTAITFVTPEEYRRLFLFRRISGKTLKKTEVPAVESIIEGKKSRLAAKIAAKAQATDEAGDPLALWRGLARELLASMEPETALAAALSEGFSDQLDPGKYREITEISVDDTATSRLYIGAGKADNVTTRTLVGMVKRLSGLSDGMIVGAEVYETFSFVTVPFKYAEKIITEARRAGGFPQVRRAVPRKPGQGGEGGGEHRPSPRYHAGADKDGEPRRWKAEGSAPQKPWSRTPRSKPDFAGKPGPAGHAGPANYSGPHKVRVPRPKKFSE